MTNNIVITLSCGTDSPNRTTRAVFLAAAAQKTGKNATLFLLDEGVYIAKKGMADNIRATTGDSCDDSLAHLQATGVPVLVCSPCAVSRGIKEEDLIEGAKMSTAAELIELSCDGAVISL